MSTVDAGGSLTGGGLIVDVPSETQAAALVPGGGGGAFGGGGLQWLGQVQEMGGGGSLDASMGGL